MMVAFRFLSKQNLKAYPLAQFMKLHFLDRTDTQNKTISVHHNKYPHFLKLWHYHEQLELVLILKSKGTRFVGDNIEKFSEGEIILLGKNLPHMWLNDKSYFEKNKDLVAEAIAVHFKEDFLGADFFTSPETLHIAHLFTQAQRGIKFKSDSPEIREEIKKLVTLDDFDRMVKVLQILHLLAKEQDYTLLASSTFMQSFNKTENSALDKVYSYIFNNFKNPIKLQDVADIANMNHTAFSRFFKKASRKTFSRYLNEIRVGYACKLLLEQKFTITDICYESGFNNLSNFNRQFKAITHYSPSEYLHQFNALSQ